MLVSPVEFLKLDAYLKGKGIEYTFLMNNVEQVVEKENERHLGTVFSSYSGFDYGRYHTLSQVFYDILLLSVIFDEGYRPERSYTFLLLGTGIVLVLFWIYPIVPHALAFYIASYY